MCFRCLVGADIPLNDGCLVPLRIVIPPGTFLSPEPGAAVVAGNTEVSQAVCNALFGALGRDGLQPGHDEQLPVRRRHTQYYETICGGCGAGPGFAGASAIQTHMTNTRMTDPEVLELRYPVRLEEFSIRRGSGGAGRWRGGDGSVRRIRFLEPMQAVIVASRRSEGRSAWRAARPALPGEQWVDRADGTRADTDRHRFRPTWRPGDVFTIATPGGGGCGAPR